MKKKDRVSGQGVSGSGVPLKAYDAVRIEITEEMRDRLSARDRKGEVSRLSARTGLRYSLIYNLVRGRIHSLSVAEYRRIFGEDPPVQAQERVKGDYFRGMVRLWMFLHQGIKEKDLYREFYGDGKSLKRAEYRIFSGATKTVEARLERAMEQKFLSQGLDRSQVIRWIHEFEEGDDQERVPYEKARADLQFLRETLGIHPTHLLRRGLGLYEQGQLKSISKQLHDDVLALKEKTQKALEQGSRLDLERLREEVYGKRKNLVRFYEVEEDLKFLQTWAGVGAKKYLGRSAGIYRRALLKRIASWRAERIREDCDRAAAEVHHVPLLSLPARHVAAKTETLILFLKALAVQRLIADKTLSHERLVMTPKHHSKEEYENGGYGFLTFQGAATFLGMKQKAFDLLVAAHRDIFMRIVKYDKIWLIPELYLKELLQDENFPLVKAKYELLAITAIGARRIKPDGLLEKKSHNQAELQAGPARQSFSRTSLAPGFSKTADLFTAHVGAVL